MQDGRFLRRKAYPLLWDARANNVMVATTSATVLDRVLNVFKGTFGIGLPSRRRPEGRNRAARPDSGRYPAVGLHSRQWCG